MAQTGKVLAIIGFILACMGIAAFYGLENGSFRASYATANRLFDLGYVGGALFLAGMVMMMFAPIPKKNS